MKNSSKQGDNISPEKLFGMTSFAPKHKTRSEIPVSEPEAFRNGNSKAMNERGLKKTLSLENTFRLSKAPAVVVGTCGHGLTLLRSLAGSDLPLIALEANSGLPGVHTNLATVEMVADINGPQLIDSLVKLRTRIDCPGLPVLLLTNDAMVRTVCLGWHRLADKYRLSWSDCAENVLPLLDKKSLETRSHLQGLNYPESFIITCETDVQKAISKIGFPMIVKPTHPLKSFKTFIPKSAESLLGWVNNYRADLPFIAQELISGDEGKTFFSALYLDHGKVLARFDGRKIRSRPMGHTTIAESFPDDEVYQQTLKFFDGLKLSGPVSLELKRAPDGRLWVIEPTVGRTDFWIGLCTANGVNLPMIDYHHQVGETIPEMRQSNKAVWFNEERDPLGRAWFATRSRLKMNSRNSMYLYLYREDPRPAGKALRKIIWKSIGRVINFPYKLGMVAFKSLKRLIERSPGS